MVIFHSYVELPEGTHNMGQSHKKRLTLGKAIFGIPIFDARGKNQGTGKSFS